MNLQEHIPEISNVLIELTVNYTMAHIELLDKKEVILLGGIKYKIIASYTNDPTVLPEGDLRAVSYAGRVLTKTYILQSIK